MPSFRLEIELQACVNSVEIRCAVVCKDEVVFVVDPEANLFAEDDIQPRARCQSEVPPGDVLVVDEPETYLHPRVQRQLLQILRETGAQVVLATHSATLIASAQTGEVAGVERTRRSLRRYEETGTPLCEKLGLLPEAPS